MPELLDLVCRPPLSPPTATPMCSSHRPTTAIESLIAFSVSFFSLFTLDRGRSTCSHRPGSRSFVHSFCKKYIFFLFKAAGIEGCAHRRCHHNSVVELGDCGVPMVLVVFVGASTRRGEERDETRREEKRKENKVKCGPGEVVVKIS